ncbi:hypothetical protein MSIBF_A1530002 [groundwater metagenome]|uniref:Uncharacterized protein n=1 Tax=groundwater metagenome TaxID=717931 RepID=A0A098E7S8_9ZZZZ
MKSYFATCPIYKLFREYFQNEILKISERFSKLQKFCKYTNEVSVSEVTKFY